MNCLKPKNYLLHKMSLEFMMKKRVYEVETKCRMRILFSKIIHERVKAELQSVALFSREGNLRLGPTEIPKELALS